MCGFLGPIFLALASSRAYVEAELNGSDFNIPLK